MPTTTDRFPARLRRLPVLLALAALVAGLAARPASAQSPTVQDAIRTRVEELRSARPVAVRGATLFEPKAVSAFFEARQFAPAWTVPAAVSQAVKAIKDVEADGLTPRDYHLAAIESALDERTASPSVTLEADLQLLVTDALAAVADHVRYGKVDPVVLDESWNVDARIAAAPLETVLEQVVSAPSIADTIAGFKPNHFIYLGLKGALARYRAIAAKGGWPSIPAGPTVKPGGSDTRLRLVRQRLAVTGELEAPATDSDVLDPALEAAIRSFQERHRLAVDGSLGKSTVDAMNVPVGVRIDQIRVNIERARWVINGLRDSFVLVNLPAFKVYVIRDTKNVWETRAQIGKEARQTPSFRADMRYIVFNPDWTVPPTILKEDVLKPMASGGSNPIKKKGLTIVDRQGNLVDPSKVDWKKANASNFPYTLRQPPGTNNALGRVKFMFPNEHAIFLHDTPSRELFASETRTFSSGCIRVEKPLDLAAVLLEGQDNWTRERVQQVVDNGASETVYLKQPLPVVIVYWTVSVGASGDVRFARDVYRHDLPLLKVLDGPPGS